MVHIGGNSANWCSEEMTCINGTRLRSPPGVTPHVQTQSMRVGRTWGGSCKNTADNEKVLPEFGWMAMISVAQWLHTRGWGSNAPPPPFVHELQSHPDPVSPYRKIRIWGAGRNIHSPGLQEREKERGSTLPCFFL